MIPANDQDLSKKIVLIGGTFRRKDEFLGPAGEIAGIALNAAAIEAELSGYFLHEAPRWMFFLFDVMLGGCLIYWEIKFPPKTIRDKFIRVGLATLIVFGLSTVLMYFNMLWLSWSGLLLAMLIVFLTEVDIENPKLEDHGEPEIKKITTSQETGPTHPEEPAS